MTRQGRLAVQATVLTILVLGNVMTAGAAPVLSFASDRVIADGVTLGGESVWFGVVHSRRGWDRVIQRVDEVIVDGDNDGMVELVWEGGALPYQSVWVVVDSATGEHAYGVPPGMALRENMIGKDDLVLDDNGEVAGVIQRQGRYLEAVLVSPGAGVWWITSGDGSPNDGDGVADGKITVDFQQMRSRYGDLAAPEVAGPGDIVVAVDALELSIGVYQTVDKAMPLEGNGEEVTR